MGKRREDDKILDVNAAMKGSLVFADSVNLRINGKFEGTLTTKGSLIIGRAANVEAEITGEEITISGTLKGKVKATKGLILTSTAQVNAELDSVNISIEKGALFNGVCKMPHGKMGITELSDYLSIEEGKIIEWVNDGKIPADKEGKDLFFDREQVDIWISKQK